MRPWAIRLAYVPALAAGAALVTGCLSAGAAAGPSPAPVPAPYVVAVDAGHGGTPDNAHPELLYDSGAVANGLQEKDLTLALALRLKTALEADGVKVVMTRTDDSFVDLSPRLERAKAGAARLFVSIHFNYFSDPSIEGSLVMYPNLASAPFAQIMATALQRGLIPYGIASNGIVSNPGLWVHATMPAVTVEGAYLTNLHDAQLLRQPAVLDTYANSIRAGVEAQAPEILRLKQEAAVRHAAAVRAAASAAAARKAVHLPGWLPWAGGIAVGAVLLALLARPLMAAIRALAAAVGRRGAGGPSRRPGRHRRRQRAELSDLPTLQPRRR